MSDMKCPFCGKRLDAVVKNQNDWIYSCGNPSCEFFDDCDNYEKKHYLATPEFWQELIRTRKALDVAMKGLYDIFTTRPNGCALNSMKAKETMDKVKRLVGTNNTSVSSADLLAYQDHQSMPIKTALEQKD